MINLILDTDMGTDDVIALGLLNEFYAKNLKVVISSYGNVEGKQAYRNLRNVYSFLQLDVKTIYGADFPQNNSSLSRIQTDYHGKDGFCGVEIPEVLIKEKNDGYCHKLYSYIMKFQPVKYICIGPLTNLATLLIEYPDAINYIGEIIIMGGGFEIFNIQHDTEFNFASDPVSTSYILTKYNNIKLIPLDVTHKLVLLEDELNYMLADKFDTDKVIKFYSEILLRNYETAKRHGNQGALIHDSIAVMSLFDDIEKKYIRKNVVVDQYGKILYTEDGNAINVMSEVNKEQYIDKLRQMFVHKHV